MTRIIANKLHQLVGAMHDGQVLTLSRLNQKGISSKLAWWYLNSGWLERLEEGIYKKPGDVITWFALIEALQNQLFIPIHVGGKTALEVLGQAHFLPLGGIKEISLFMFSSTNLPSWVQKYNKNETKFKINRSSFLKKEDYNLGLIKRKFEGIEIILSAPERAIFEVLYLVPNKQSYDEAFKIIEHASSLRPKLIQELLEKCKSIKVKRLFLCLSEAFNHPWLKSIEVDRINLGKGKRKIGEGGVYNSKYQISLPTKEEES